jgi:hypothetical protein
VVGGGRGSRGGSLGRSLQGWEVVFGLFGVVLWDSSEGMSSIFGK